MSKRKNFVEPVDQEEEEYYLEAEETEAEETVSEEEKKPSGNDKKLELALLKEQNKARQLELEERKFEFEKFEAEAKREFESKKLETETQLEERKIAVSEKQNEIADKQITEDKKKSKRERIFGYVKAGVGILGVGLSCFFSMKKFHEGMIFEETGSFRTATGKD